MILLKNKKQLICIFITGYLTTVLSVSAFAETNVVSSRLINTVQQKQAESIKQGIKVGKLTPREARRLRREQEDIKDLERKMRGNGSLDTEEIAMLFKLLEQARNNINKLLRNSISSYGHLDATTFDIARTD